MTVLILTTYFNLVKTFASIFSFSLVLVGFAFIIFNIISFSHVLLLHGVSPRLDRQTDSNQLVTEVYVFISFFSFLYINF